MQATCKVFKAVPELVLAHWDFFVSLMITESALRTPLITIGTGSVELLGSPTPPPSPSLPILNAFGVLN